MNFNEFWNKHDIWTNDPYISDNPVDLERKCAEYGWNSAKEEILKIIFLNTKVNGKKSLDIEELIKQIEEL